MVGFGVCVFSLVNAFGLVCLDRAAEKSVTEAEVEEKKKEKPF